MADGRVRRPRCSVLGWARLAASIAIRRGEGAQSPMRGPASAPLLDVLLRRLLVAAALVLVVGEREVEQALVEPAQRALLHAARLALALRRQHEEALGVQLARLRKTLGLGRGDAAAPQPRIGGREAGAILPRAESGPAPRASVPAAGAAGERPRQE